MREYAEAEAIFFPVLAEAESVRKAWGVGLIWGNVVRLVDPDGRVVADTLRGAAKKLEAR